MTETFPENNSARIPDRVAIEPGYFTIPLNNTEAPHLLGSRCTACGECFFPRRVVCAKCLHRQTEDMQLSPTGTLYTYTYVHFPLFGGGSVDKGYGVGQIDLPEGPRVQAVLKGGPGDFRIGMPLVMELETLRKNDKGQEVVIFRFHPLEAVTP